MAVTDRSRVSDSVENSSLILTTGETSRINFWMHVTDTCTYSKIKLLG